MLDPSHLQRANKLSKVETIQQYTVKITKKEHLVIWNSETTQNLNIYIYLYNYQTEIAIFLATEHCYLIFLKNISFILNFWPAVL